LGLTVEQKKYDKTAGDARLPGFMAELRSQVFSTSDGIPMLLGRAYQLCNHAKLRQLGIDFLLSRLNTNEPNLYQVNLATSDVDDDRALQLSQALMNNSTVETLDLYGNNIGAVGSKYLTQMLMCNNRYTIRSSLYTPLIHSSHTLLAYSVTSLNLDCNPIPLAAAKHFKESLAGNSTLTTLHLSETELGDAGAEQLVSSLETNSSITTLSLAHNSIKSAGVVRLAKSLERNFTLTVLDLQWNQV
jgi:Ran GTPase-activating protein (RanGAP) involved in mRNA processing and transport